MSAGVPGSGEIFMQFLIESITLSVAGAAIGLLGGIGVVKLVGNAFPAGLPVSMFGLTVASGFAVSIGLLAGLAGCAVTPPMSRPTAMTARLSAVGAVPPVISEAGVVLPVTGGLTVDIDLQSPLSDGCYEMRLLAHAGPG